MEANTIGKFIAILRKAKGITQKELGELLNVSDKTVSRWERDETLPDVTMIPILADILEVTSDELLRGARSSGNIKPESDDSKNKRIEWVLSKSLNKYRSLSFISISLAAMGLIAAFIVNFMLHKAVWGFCCFLFFLFPAGLCQISLYLFHNPGIEVQDISAEILLRHRKQLKHLTRKISYVLILLFSICLPLLCFGRISYIDYLVSMGIEEFSVNDSTMAAMAPIEIGLQLKSWILYGALFGVIAIMILTIYEGLLKYILDKNNQPLKFTIVTLLIVSATIGGSLYIHKIIPPYLTEGCEFTDYQSFTDYMETIPQDMAWGIVELRKDNPYWIRQVCDIDGNVLCEYTLYNDDVAEIKYSKYNTRLPITTYTQEQLAAGREKADNLTWIVVLIVILEAVTAYLIYKKRLSHSKKPRHS